MNFPLFSRNNLGKAYDQEEDPDFDEIGSTSEDEEDSFDEESEILDFDKNDDEIEEVIKVKDANAEGSMIEDLSVMVEDLKIPDEFGNDDSEEEVDFTDEDDTELSVAEEIG